MALDDPTNPVPEITITIGADGRVHFLDLTPELLAVAAAMCPESEQLQALQAAYEAMKSEENHGNRTAAEEA
jgi:hypothetical protein